LTDTSSPDASRDETNLQALRAARDAGDVAGERDALARLLAPYWLWGRSIAYAKINGVPNRGADAEEIAQELVRLTTALNILPGGYVVVGSLPTTNGKSATAKYGCLIVLNSEGKAVETIASKNIQGPWDSTAKSEGSKTMLFVSNALNGGAAKGVHTIDNSTVLRIELESGEGQTPKVLSETVIADGIPWIDSAEALVLGPTGLALASNGTLYVASTEDSKILAVSEAMTRTTPAAKGGTVLTEGGHLKEPLGMVLAPNGNIITSNGW
jgi:hypothetical protein